jgi:hypothetical protein
MRVSCINRALCSGGSPSTELGSQTAADGASIALRHHLSFVKCRSRITNGMSAARLRASGDNLDHNSRFSETSGTWMAEFTFATPASSSRQCSFRWCTSAIDWQRFQRGAITDAVSNEVPSDSLTCSSAHRQGESHSDDDTGQLLREESGLFAPILVSRVYTRQFIAEDA